jgi:hypothetical protein
MDALSLILRDGAVLSLTLGAILIGSLAVNARLWLQDAPKEIRDQAPPLSPRERRQRALVGVLFLTTLLGNLLVSLAGLVARSGGAPSFLAAFVHVYGVLMVFNLFDLLIVDYLLGLIIRPKFLRVFETPGLSYEKVFGGFGYHFKAFCKGSVMLAGMAAFVAGALSFFR